MNQREQALIDVVGDEIEIVRNDIVRLLEDKSKSDREAAILSINEGIARIEQLVAASRAELNNEVEALKAQFKSIEAREHEIIVNLGKEDLRELRIAAETRLLEAERRFLDLCTGSTKLLDHIRSLDLRGPSGVDGKDGAPGADGRDGVDGLQGRDGKDGVDGKDGRDGEAGPRGERGEDGAAGKDGVDGPAGRDGIDGKDGAPGERGEQGLPGEKGDKGDPGDIGPAGEPGPPGPQGVPGDPGPPGERGLDGAPGEKGDQGPPGQDGLPGAVGEKGDRGDTGPAGPPGIPGPQGLSLVPVGTWSKDGLYKKGDIVTWNGTSWFVLAEVSGEEPGKSAAYQIVVNRPRDGKDGKPGPRGERGESGPPGRDAANLIDVRVIGDRLTFTLENGTILECSIGGLVEKGE